MAGYSQTPLPKKLGLKPGSRLRLTYAADDFLAEDEYWSRTDGPCDVAVCFCTRSDQVEEAFRTVVPDLAVAGGLWVAWPKRTSRLACELNENAIRDIGLAAGLVDNKVCAIDDDWSGLRFVRRLKDR